MRILQRRLHERLARLDDGGTVSCEKKQAGSEEEQLVSGTRGEKVRRERLKEREKRVLTFTGKINDNKHQQKVNPCHYFR